MIKQEGFTLIELVVVIVIVAILAVAALPRFADLSDDAHHANVEGTYGAFSVAANLVRAQWIAKGKPVDVDDLPGFGDSNVNVSVDGWAVGSSGTDNSTSMNTGRCIEIWRALLIEQAPTVGTSPDVDYGVSVGGSSECLYTYQGGGQMLRTITYDAATGGVYKDNT